MLPLTKIQSQVTLLTHFASGNGNQHRAFVRILGILLLTFTSLSSLQ